MAVKCDNDENHPLGYLHTSFMSSISTTENVGGNGYRFSCTCNITSANKKKNTSILSLNTPEILPSNSPEVKTRCIHFYSCIAAFSSDPALAKEFSRFISDDQVVSSMQQVIAILGDEGTEVTGEDNLDLFASSGETVLSYKQDDLESAFHIDVETEDGHTIALTSINAEELTPLLGSSLSPIKRREDCLSSIKTEANNQHIDSLRNNYIGSDSALHQPPIFQLNCDPATPNAHLQPNGSHQPVQTASEMISSITEMINETMHYGYSGTPDPLIFMVPQGFFDHLMDRISAGSKKKRLPNTTQAIERHSPPRGKFTRYTWVLTNVSADCRLLNIQSF